MKELVRFVDKVFSETEKLHVVCQLTVNNKKRTTMQKRQKKTDFLELIKQLKLNTTPETFMDDAPLPDIHVSVYRTMASTVQQWDGTGARLCPWC